MGLFNDDEILRDADNGSMKDIIYFLLNTIETKFVEYIKDGLAYDRLGNKLNVGDIVMYSNIFDEIGFCKVVSLAGKKLILNPYKCVDNNIISSNNNITTEPQQVIKVTLEMLNKIKFVFENQ